LVYAKGTGDQIWVVYSYGKLPVYGTTSPYSVAFEQSTMKIKPYASPCLALLMGIALCASVIAQDNQGLKDFYQPYFTMGVAVTPRSVEPGAEADLIKKHFGSLTAENVMKPQPIHPSENEYNWKPADQLVEFAKTNGLKMRGHTLCWHNQTPEWFFKDKKGNTASRDVVLQRLRDHIHTVVGRYKGSIYAWDVVNEAVPDAPGEIYRDSPWYRIVGEDYIAKAFEYAHEADPQALLFYNDYNTENPSKRDRIYTLVKGLIDQGVPIHGVGLQGHWSIDQPTAQALEESIVRFASLGLTVQITELDVSVYPKGKGRSEVPSTPATAITSEQEQMQLDQYKMIMEVCRKHKEKLSGVTFWNISDRHSWLDNFPVKNRKDFPLLFDQNLQPKKAYWEVVNFR
jgi:endo-1,4-beta-xylanase